MGVAVAPDSGDIIWLSLDPALGHEQAGRRPFLVLSPREYNAKTGLLVGCPVTSRVKGFPFEVALSPRAKIGGVVLADQIRNIDWRARFVGIAGRVAKSEARVVARRAATLIGAFETE